MSESARDDDRERKFGKRMMATKNDLHQPSEQDGANYEITHIPFHRYCRHCIRGRGREEDCRKPKERDVQEIQLEFMCVGSEKEGKTLAFLSAREKSTKAVCSTGGIRRYTIVKSDNEPRC